MAGQGRANETCMPALRHVGYTGACQQQWTGWQQGVGDTLDSRLGVDDILVVLALAAQSGRPPGDNHHMHRIEAAAPPLEVGAHQQRWQAHS
jgi:hypothetical protein